MFTCSWSAVHFQKVLSEGKYFEILLSLFTSFSLKSNNVAVAVACMSLIITEVPVEIEI